MKREKSMSFSNISYAGSQCLYINLSVQFLFAHLLHFVVKLPVTGMTSKIKSHLFSINDWMKRGNYSALRGSSLLDSEQKDCFHSFSTNF
jgi:hypothetical protein